MKLKRLIISCSLALAMTAGIAVPASASYETSVRSFECRGMTVPAYRGRQCEVVNNNKTSFTATEKASRSAYEIYSSLDSKGRVGAVSANIDKSSLPKSGRGDISQIFPTGWVQNKYSESLVEYGWLFNRSHLYAFSLGGDDTKKNLCTGCRAFNYDGMFKSVEEPVLQHVKKSGEHVLYRVTPVFFGSEMLSRGVLIEAESLESEAINICTFCYNLQPGIAIDYLTGANKLTDAYRTSIKKAKVKKIPDKIYSGKSIKPICYVTDAKGKTLKYNKDFVVRYVSNVLPGKATAIIEGKGDYIGSTSTDFYIVPARGKVVFLKSSKKTLTVKWKKHEGISGYQIRYRMAGSKGNKLINVGKKVTTQKIKKLKKGKKYFVQVRAYKKAGGKKLFGEYSRAKKIKVK